MYDTGEILYMWSMVFVIGVFGYLYLKNYFEQKQKKYWDLWMRIHVLYHFDDEFKSFIHEMEYLYHENYSLLAQNIFGFKLKIEKKEADDLRQRIEIKANSIFNDYNRKKDIIKYKIEFRKKIIQWDRDNTTGIIQPQLDILLYGKAISEIFKSNNKTETDKLNVDIFMPMFALKMNISESEARKIIDGIESSSKIVWEYNNFIHQDFYKFNNYDYVTRIIEDKVDDETISRFIGFEKYKYFNL